VVLEKKLFKGKVDARQTDRQTEDAAPYQKLTQPFGTGEQKMNIISEKLTFEHIICVWPLTPIQLYRHMTLLWQHGYQMLWLLCNNPPAIYNCESH